MSELTAERFRDAGSGLSGWRVRTRAARGIATPALAGGLVVFGGGFGSHDVFAVDAESGRLVWHVHTRDDGPTAATITDGVVLFNTESCTLEALELASGRSLWEKWLGDPLLSQPAAADHRVLMVYPRNGKHVLSAFGLHTGERQWELEVEHDVITAPVLQDGMAYIATYDGAVSCIDATTGTLRWRQSMGATSAPWVYEGKVYVAQRDGARGFKREESPRAPAAADAEPAARERTTRMDALSGDPASPDLFGFKQARYLRPEWGHERKARFVREDAAVGFMHEPAAAKLDQVRKLVGESRVSRAWRFQGSRPVVRDGVLFETSGDVLEARDVNTGCTKWSWTEAQAVDGERRLTPPVVANGRVVVGAWDGRIISLSAEDGSMRWAVDVGAPCHWQPAMADGRVVAGLEDGSVVAIETGDPHDDAWPMWGGGPGHNG